MGAAEAQVAAATIRNPAAAGIIMAGVAIPAVAPTAAEAAMVEAAGVAEAADTSGVAMAVVVIADAEAKYRREPLVYLLEASR